MASVPGNIPQRGTGTIEVSRGLPFPWQLFKEKHAKQLLIFNPSELPTTSQFQRTVFPQSLGFPMASNFAVLDTLSLCC